MQTDQNAAQIVLQFEAALQKVASALYPLDIPVHNAAKYALLSGGKRIRPVICLQACASVSETMEHGLLAAVAVEMIHTYSLIHDDLPCMDNDDLRRGLPTTHKKFGEDIALLAGDALLTDAFTVLSVDEITGIAGAPEARRLAQVAILSSAAGGTGMVLGQALDLFWTARTGAQRTDLDSIHLNKTGKLLGAAAALGAAAGGATPEVTRKFREFGELIGLSFQIRDDLLDTQAGTGKSIGKDAQAGKLTYATTMSAEKSAAAASTFTEQALMCLRSTGAQSAALEATARQLLERSK